MTYTAPVREIDFLINKVIGLDQINTLPGFEEATEDLVTAILEESAKFCGDVLAPLNRIGDEPVSYTHLTLPTILLV